MEGELKKDIKTMRAQGIEIVKALREQFEAKGNGKDFLSLFMKKGTHTQIQRIHT